MLQHHNPNPELPKRVIIVGSSGFIGSALASKLREAGVSILTLSSKDLDLANADAGDRLADMIEPSDALLMLSVLTPDKGRDAATLIRNLTMAKSVCTALEKSPCSHVIYFSSDAVYSFDSALISEDTPAAPTDLYGVMHRTREIMFETSVKSPLAVFRATLVFGHGDTHNSYGPNRFRRMAAKDGKITLFGGGEETRDHILVDDVAALTLQVLMDRSAGILNVATGKSISFIDAANLVAGQFDARPEVVCTPRANPITYRSFDPTTCRKAFPTFKFTPIEEGIARVHRQMMESMKNG